MSAPVIMDQAEAARRWLWDSYKPSSPKLTRESVEEIRMLYDSGFSQRAIAREFDVSQTTISHVVHGRLHKDGAA